MIVLDTTLLLYAVGAHHRLREPARSVIDAIGAGRLAATTTPEVIQEFSLVRTRRHGRRDAVGLARDLTVLLTPLTPVTADDLRSGLGLFERHEGIGCFDAVLAAVARRVAAPVVSGDSALVAALGDDAIDLGGPALAALT